MATKLRKLCVTSVDLVDCGANPESFICLFKRNSEHPEGIGDDNGTQAGGKPDGEGAKMHAGADKEPDITKNIPVKEEYDTMKIDKSKMTPEEISILEDYEKRYGMDEAPMPEDADGVTKGAEDVPADGGVEKSAEPVLHPEVQKALSDMRAAYDEQTKQMEALQKSLDIERLTTLAKKYEVLGRNPEELAAKLYDLKKAGGTVYDDYIALLDENLNLIGKSHIFGEIGSSRQGNAEDMEETVKAKAAELAKSATMTNAEAVIKAFEDNPEIAAKYEQEYRGR